MKKKRGTCNNCKKRMTHKCDNYKAEGKYLSDGDSCAGWKGEKQSATSKKRISC